MRISYVALAAAVAGALTFALLGDSLSPAQKIAFVVTTFLAWAGGALFALLWMGRWSVRPE